VPTWLHASTGETRESAYMQLRRDCNE
jgi:hypothetical protein